MKNSKNEFAVGLTVLIALAILIFSILWGKQISMTTGTYRVNVRFTDIAGLEIGAPVLVNGIRKGKVLDFQLEQEGVVVEMSLNEDVILYTDAVFEVTSPELMGGKVISIYPGVSGKNPEAGFVFQGTLGGGMNRLMKLSSDLVQDVQHLTKVLESTIENINKTTGDPKLREALISSVHNFDESSQRTLDIISNNEAKLTRVMDNLVVSTEILRELLQTNRTDVEGAVNDLEEFAAKLRLTAERIDKLTSQIETRQGALGMLISDSVFASKLQTTIDNLDSLILQIREEGIQTNISLFGRRKKR